MRNLFAVVAVLTALFPLSAPAHAQEVKDVTEEWAKKIDGTTMKIADDKSFEFPRTVEFISAEQKGDEMLLLFVSKQLNAEVTVKGLKNEARLLYQPNLFRHKEIAITKDEQKEKFIRRGLINLHFKWEEEKSSSDDKDKIGTDEDPVLRPIR